MTLLRLTLAIALLGAAGPAAAGPLEIVFADGRVTVRATDVPLRQILQEWARQGQTRIVGLEKLAGAPLTIELVEVPEKQALEILLRSVAGYLAAPRAAAAGPTLSSFDRLLVLPTSVASAAPVGGPRPVAFAPPPQPVVPDPIQLANGDGEAGDPPAPGTTPFTPSPDAVTPAGPGNQFRPPPIPGDPGTATPAVLETPQPQSPGPLTAPRPGILPAPQNPPPRP